MKSLRIDPNAKQANRKRRRSMATQIKQRKFQTELHLVEEITFSRGCTCGHSKDGIAITKNFIKDVALYQWRTLDQNLTEIGYDDMMDNYDEWSDPDDKIICPKCAAKNTRWKILKSKVRLNEFYHNLLK